MAPHVLTVHHLVRDAAESTCLNLFSRMKDFSGENGFLIPQIEKRALGSVDKIIAVSNYTKDRVLQTYNISSEMVDVVYNGVDFDGYSFVQEDLDEVRKQLGLSDLPVILFVGRVDDPRKGLDVLIQAFRKVLDEIDVTLLVVGKGDQTAARSLAGPALDRIVFTGFVDDVTLKKCYALCDVYVCPSRFEGFGLTILEALSVGKPVISTNVGIVTEMAQMPLIIVSPDSMYDLRDSILCMLSQPIGQFQRLNLDSFSWKAAVKQINMIYQAIL